MLDMESKMKSTFVVSYIHVCINVYMCKHACRSNYTYVSMDGWMDGWISAVHLSEIILYS
jgi:hypothetical protein